ncbi:MAG TPA: hypothetical protein VNQ90_02885 [Chthoniobacteraceae bacterium]|nr:hypothetical protein [Chthoniobacteraceae bacterium]
MDKTFLILTALLVWAISAFAQDRQVTAEPGTGVLRWPSASSFRSANAIPEKPIYAVFHIPMPKGFTDFELKASTDNYATMVFFYHSPDPGKMFIPSQIWTNRPDVYFTDSQLADRRQWIKQSASQSITAMRVNSSSEIGGVILVVKDTGGAITPDNGNLVWTYCLMTPTGTEDDSSGRSIWRPIIPTWTTQPFNP